MKVLVRGMCAVVMLVAVVGRPRVAGAHKPSDSYLTLSVHGARVEGRWDIALRDLQHAIGVDADGDGAITWAEVRARHEGIAGYALGRLALDGGGGGAACALRARGQQIVAHSDGAYTVLRFTADCPAEIETLGVGYSLFFDVDPQHRGLVRVDAGGAAQTVIFRAGDGVRRLAPARGAAGLAASVRDGVRQTWVGLERILLLLALLLPSVLARRQGRWHIGPVAKDAAAVVTAFAAAQAAALAFSALGWFDLPRGIAGPAVTMSIALAAVLNLFPAAERPWGRRAAAIALGVLRGASVAGPAASAASITSVTSVTSIAGFNVGVELALLVMVAVCVPLAYLARRSWAFWRAGPITASRTPRRSSSPPHPTRGVRP